MKTLQDEGCWHRMGRVVAICSRAEHVDPLREGGLIPIQLKGFECLVAIGSHK